MSTNKLGLPNLFIKNNQNFINRIKARRSLTFNPQEKDELLRIYTECLTYIYADNPKAVQLHTKTRGEMGCGSCVRKMFAKVVNWFNGGGK